MTKLTSSDIIAIRSMPFNNSYCIFVETSSALRKAYIRSVKEFLKKIHYLRSHRAFKFIEDNSKVSPKNMDVELGLGVAICGEKE